MNGGRRFVVLHVAVLAAIAPARALIGGAVVTDGSVGPAGALQGPHFLVPAGLGRQVGPNLFQSFSTLNLDKGETATFTASASTHNILARVTGGSISNIDGTIATRLDTNSATPHPAAFYLINPAGVVFGPDARLDVGGSFVVTTADTIHLGDGGHFDVSTPGGSLLTSSAPSAFGFLASAPQPVLISGTTLTVPSGQALSILGGSGAQVQNASLTAPAGRINLISLGGSGQITGDAANPALTLTTAPQQVFGNLFVSGSALSTRGTTAGGDITLSAAALNISSSTVSVYNSSPTAGGGIQLLATGDVSITGSTIGSITAGNASSGDILLTGNDITLSGASLASSTNGIGAGGNITLRAGGALTLVDHGLVATETFGSATGGSITASAARILIDAGTTALDTGLLAATNAAGSAGAVNVSTGGLTIQNGFSAIFSLSTGSGNSGPVSIDASNIVINHLQTDGFLGIATETFSGGNAGMLTINTGTLSSTGGTFLSGVADDTGSTSLATGAGGTLIINATGSIYLNNAGIRADTNLSATNGAITVPGNILISSPLMTFTNNSLISTGTNAGAAGGLIHLTGTDLSLSGNSTIASSTLGTGRAGNIDVSITGRLTITGEPANPNVSTGIFSNANAGAGAGGDVQVTADTVQIIGPNAGIEANSFSAGNGGAVTVNARLIDLDRSAPSVFLTGIAAQADATGNGGTIDINTHTLAVIGGAVISATAFGPFATGKAGSININASGTVVVRGKPGGYFSGISSSDTAANGGGGGDITLSADAVRVTDKGYVAALSSSAAPAGNIRITTAGNLTLTRRGEIDIAATGQGGDINVLSRSGNINLQHRSLISAIAGAGGNINLDAADRIDVDRSLVTARAQHTGGQITLGRAAPAPAAVAPATASPLPRFVILNSSVIDGRVADGGRDLPVRIRARQFLASADSRILSNATSLPPEFDIIGSLASLQVSLALPTARLVPQCTSATDAVDQSSFVFTGAGGSPLTPGGWSPNLSIDLK